MLRSDQMPRPMVVFGAPQAAAAGFTALLARFSPRFAQNTAYFSQFSLIKWPIVAQPAAHLCGGETMVTAGSCVLRLSALAAASAAASATDAGARLTGLGAGAAFPESRLITHAQGMLLNGWANQTAGQRWELCYTSFAKMTKSVEEFHGSCDEYQLTVTVARNSLNRTFGGFVRAFLPPSSLSSKLVRMRPRGRRRRPHRSPTPHHRLQYVGVQLRHAVACRDRRRRQRLRRVLHIDM
eukprot:COSAG06_NODE_10452_length_1679_cov_1.444937_3_plen_239_part_00